MTWWQKLLLVGLGFPWAYVLVNRISTARPVFSAPRNWLLAVPRFWLGIPYTLYWRRKFKHELSDFSRSTLHAETDDELMRSSPKHWTPTPRDSATRARRRETKEARRRNWYQ